MTRTLEQRAAVKKEAERRARIVAAYKRDEHPVAKWRVIEAELIVALLQGRNLAHKQRRNNA